MSIGTGAAVLGAGALSGISGIFGSQAAIGAAGIQAQAAEQAIALQQQMFQTIQGNLSPYLTAGTTALNKLSPMVTGGAFDTKMPTTWGMTNEFSPTMSSLAMTPGYQFTLQQGQQALTNQYASQGLGGSISGRSASPSGPLAAAQTQYASGLASGTFNQQYQNWLAGQGFQLNANLSRNAQNFNILNTLSGTGQNAAAQLGAFGNQAVGQANNYLTSGAAAQAGGVIGSANALTGGAAGAGGALQNYAFLNAINNGGLYGGGVNQGTLNDVTAFNSAPVLNQQFG